MKDELVVGRWRTGDEIAGHEHADDVLDPSHQDVRKYRRQD
jgi:hypothetical protein